MIKWIQININFQKIDFAWAIKKSIKKSTLLVHRKAQKNAPVWDYRAVNKKNWWSKQGWTLKRSITFDIKKDMWVVWPTVPYWRIREYINNKNPKTKFYMKRALESSGKEIEDIFFKELLNVYSS